MLGSVVSMLVFGISLGPIGIGNSVRFPAGKLMQPQGIVFLIDGVGGFGFTPKLMEKALAEAGVPHEIRTFQWSHGFGRWHSDLTDDTNFRAKASELANAVMEFRSCSPGPVYFIAKSGGTAIALTALAQLPADTVERCVLLSSAVSPDYDLVPALCAVRTELVSFWSPRDKLILGWGTSFFGTADGILGQSAGLVGFRIPESTDDEITSQYRKMRQVEWDSTMRKTLNFGTHIGTSMPQFVRTYVVPLVSD